MTLRDYSELAVFISLIALSAKPFGNFMEKVYSGEKTFLHLFFGKTEKFLYRFCGINPDEDQHWSQYASSVMVFSLISLLLTYAILRLQFYLPLNPQKFLGLTPDLAMNTAMSFTTNTNWQAYSGETSMSYFSQMVALTFHNFASAAVGIAVAVAVIRGIARREGKGIGNFWADLVRGTLYVLLPLSFLLAVFYISQGVIQNFLPYLQVTTLEGVKQTIALGPVASQLAIKMLGTNGGGFFNANSAHPFENPTALCNFVQILTIFLIPSALVYQLGKSVKNLAHGWSVWAAMSILFIVGVLVLAHYEYMGRSQSIGQGLSSPANMEGKEVRFGIFNSSLFATVTTDASCGAVNSMHDSLTPMGGLVPLVNMELGEIVFGGVGAGLYGMMIFIILTVFIAGLMVGRTPEYLGKKIEAREVKLVMIAMISMTFVVLGMTAWGALDVRGLSGLNNSGPHGFTEILYAFSSGVANNGSAFAGLTANSAFWNLTLAITMFVGRFFVIIPMLAVAGSLVRKKIHPGGEGTFPVHGPLFVGLLIGVIVIVGALTFFPALSLGPITEHLEMLRGKIF